MEKEQITVTDIINLIDKLATTQHLTQEEWIAVLCGRQKESMDHAARLAREVAISIYGNGIFTRGLIEFTNYCRNDCYYCGIRKSNRKVHRYRLTEEDILSCCKQGYDLGFRTFVLQGGEDVYYSDDLIAHLVEKIKRNHPDCAVTLSIGEREKESYQRFYDAGADRYLLRHETASKQHYRMLHPKELSLEHRMDCLWTLKEIGYQVGCGFMVGSYGQTCESLAQDMEFIAQLQPHMVGIGPFIPHHDTPFASQKAGTLEETLYLLSLIRLMHPNVLLPATTALGTIHPKGREMGILAGANVVMPNLSPVSVRKNYELYDNKICTNEESAECRGCLEQRMQAIGYRLLVDRGDYKEI